MVAAIKLGAAGKVVAAIMVDLMIKVDAVER